MSPCQWRNSTSRCHRSTEPIQGHSTPWELPAPEHRTPHTWLGGTGDISWGRNAPEIPWLSGLSDSSTQQAGSDSSREGQLTPSPSSHRGQKGNQESLQGEESTWALWLLSPKEAQRSSCGGDTSPAGQPRHSWSLPNQPCHAPAWHLHTQKQSFSFSTIIPVL